MRAARFTLFLICFLFSTNIFSQRPKYELRAAWIATYSNIDWPIRKETPQQQRDAFIKILDHHKATGINAIYVQVRSQSDAMYPSPYEPWSADLTGTQGLAPYPLWDPMQFMIEETRKRGMEFHAWLNPYRVAGNASNIPSFSNIHVAKQHPEWLLRSGNIRTLDPGLPAVRDHISKVISDIVKRYDVDGIHFDDYFYPDPGFNDDRSYSADPRGIANRADWRRDNVSLLIKRIGEEVKAIKPWVKFGVSPSGIYRNSTDLQTGSATSGMEHYSHLYADTRLWMQKGWVDYIEPQVYWYMGQPGADYRQVVSFWNRIASGRHVYIGIASYKVDNWARTPWSERTQIPNQVRYNRALMNENIKGHAFYNTSGMLLNLMGFRDSLRLDLFRTPALVPSMPWIDSIAPAAPYALTSLLYTDSVVLNWNRSPGIKEQDKAKQYVIYRSLQPAIKFADPENIIAIVPDTFLFTDKTIERDVTYYYSVTALDRSYNESLPSGIIATGSQKDLPVTLNSIDIRPLNDKYMGLTWATTQEKGLKQFIIERSDDGLNFQPLDTILAKGKDSSMAYSYTDTVSVFNSPMFYRLQLQLSDSTATYSRVVKETISKPIELVKLRYSKGADLILTLVVTGDMEYAVLDADRRKVTWGKIKQYPVNTRISLPGTRSLEPGNYILNIKQNNLEQNIQLIVID